MRGLVGRWDEFMTAARQALLEDLGLLLLRLVVGLSMCFAHGLGKMQKLLAGGEIKFGDPIGLGAGPSLALAGSAEFFCALAIAAGLFTRLASVPLAFTMAVAAFVAHGADPYRKKELAVLYLVACLTLFLTGPGRFSLDAMLRRKFGNQQGS